MSYYKSDPNTPLRVLIVNEYKDKLRKNWKFYIAINACGLAAYMLGSWCQDAISYRDASWGTPKFVIL